MDKESQKSVKSSNSHKDLEENIVVSNVELTFELTQKRQETFQSIGGSLTVKDLQAKAHIAKVKLEGKAAEIKDLQEVPKINKKSRKRVKTYSQAELKAFIDSAPKPLNPKHPRVIPAKKINTVRPQDVIPAPSASTYLNREYPQSRSNIKIDLKKMTLLQKSEYFRNKKTELIKEAEENRVKTEKRICTFRPNLKKGEKIKPKLIVRRRQSSKGLDSAKRSKSSIGSVRPKSVVSTASFESFRVPPPNRHFRSESLENTKDHVMLSSHYSQLTPIKKLYGFQEGADIKKIRQKSQQMLPYNAHTNRS